MHVPVPIPIHPLHVIACTCPARRQVPPARGLWQEHPARRVIGTDRARLPGWRWMMGYILYFIPNFFIIGSLIGSGINPPALNLLGFGLYYSNQAKATQAAHPNLKGITVLMTLKNDPGHSWKAGLALRIFCR